MISHCVHLMHMLLAVMKRLHCPLCLSAKLNDFASLQSTGRRFATPLQTVSIDADRILAVARVCALPPVCRGETEEVKDVRPDRCFDSRSRS